MFADQADPHLRRRLGGSGTWAGTATRPGRSRPCRRSWSAEFSTRARHIDVEKNRLIDEYVARHGRQPSTATIIKLRAQATLATRPDKEVRSLANLTSEWRTRAADVLGRDATGWAQAVTDNDPVLLLRADDVPLDVIAELGASVVGVVGEKRSTWRRWNLMAEASRQTMGWRFASMRDREAVVGMVADAAEGLSLRLTPPDLATSPVEFRRADGTSVFRPKHSTVFSSELLLAAEDRLLDRSRTLTGPTVPLATVEKVTTKPDREGRMLGEDPGRRARRRSRSLAACSTCWSARPVPGRPRP